MEHVNCKSYFIQKYEKKKIKKVPQNTKPKHKNYKAQGNNKSIKRICDIILYRFCWCRRRVFVLCTKTAHIYESDNIYT